MDDFTTGYIIGMVVGKGCFSGDGVTPTMTLSMHVRDKSVLEFLSGKVGGKVYGPYRHSGRHHSVWFLRGRDLLRSLPMFSEYLPPGYRRGQFERWLEHYFPGLGVGWPNEA